MKKILFLVFNFFIILPLIFQSVLIVRSLLVIDNLINNLFLIILHVLGIILVIIFFKKCYFNLNNNNIDRLIYIYYFCITFLFFLCLRLYIP